VSAAPVAYPFFRVTPVLAGGVVGGDIDYYCDPDTVHPAASGSGDITGH